MTFIIKSGLYLTYTRICNCTARGV